MRRLDHHEMEEGGVTAHGPTQRHATSAPVA
jgi:hypothetical protein